MKEFFNEPDVWQEPGLYAQRNWAKAWCGYVQVPEGHALFGADYSSLWQWPYDDGTASLDYILQCHGGITYAGPSYWTTPRAGWWLGFDCSHSGDLTPHDEFRGWSYSGGTYRTLSYVKQQCRELAAQIATFNLLRAE